MAKSKLEDAFVLLWRAIDGEPYEREYRFHPSRRWRFDFAWPSHLVAVEVDGGGWVAGRHTRGAGYGADCAKRNAATELGWRVLHYTGDDLRRRSSEVLDQVVRVLNERR